MVADSLQRYFDWMSSEADKIKARNLREAGAPNLDIFARAV